LSSFGDGDEKEISQILWERICGFKGKWLGPLALCPALNRKTQGAYIFFTWCVQGADQMGAHP
jgi:hypothetical protein